MAIYLGFAGYYSTRLCDDRGRAERVASLLVDPRWPWPPWWAKFSLRDQFLKTTRSRKVVGAKGAAFLREGMGSPDYRKLFVYRSSKEADDFAGAELETGQRSFGTKKEKPFESWGGTDGDNLPEGKSLGSWVELIHELMVALDVGSATIPVLKGRTACLNDVTLNTRVTLSNVDFEPPDFPRQNSRAIFWRNKLGGTYVRHPRWGNYLGRAHLDTIGGLDRIRDEVAPARIVELGDLVFIQLTEDPHDAITAECERKRRALEAVMAPIVAPVAPREDEPITFPP